MDYQEAIGILKRNKPTSDPRLCGKELCAACDVAISAMQELQEYKQKLNESYGECDGLLKTVVDGLVRHEDIDIGKPIKSRILTDEHVDLWEGYKRLGTLEEVQEAVEKQQAKKPTYDGDGYAPDGSFIWDEWLCPCCGSRFEVDYDNYYYCPDCGQKLDWSEEENDEEINNS